MKRITFEVSDDHHVKLRLMSAARKLSQKDLVAAMIDDAYLQMIRDNLIPDPRKEVKAK